MIKTVTKIKKINLKKLNSKINLCFNFMKKRCKKGMKIIKILFVMVILLISAGIFADNINSEDLKNNSNKELNALESTEAEEDEHWFKFSGVSNTTLLSASKKNLVDMDGKKVDKNYFLEDIEFNMEAKIAENFKAYTTISLGNYMDFIDGESDSYNLKVIPYYLYLNYEDEKYGKLNAGIIPFQINPYVMERADDDTYSENDRMEDGNYAMNGVDCEIKIKNIELKTWFLTMAKYGWHDSTLFDRYLFGDMKYNFGAQVKTSFGNDISVSALYMAIANNGDEDYKAGIFGGNVNVPFENFYLDFNYYTQNLNTNAKTLYDNSYNMDIKVGYSDDNLDIFGGYRTVQAGYDAPGSWDPSGVGANFTNVKGWYGEFNYSISDLFDVYGFYKNYSPDNKDYENFDNVKNIMIGLNYNITETQSVWAEYEKFNVLSGDEVSNYYTLGWRNDFSESLNFRLFYQYIDNNFDGDRNKGSLFNAQLRFSF